MIELYEFDAGQTCKLWYQEFPDAGFSTENIVRDSYAISTSEEVGENVLKIAAEIIIPRGARSIYGLLGFEFTPIEHGAEFFSEIGVLDSTESCYMESLAADIDDVYIGLGSEYFEFVQKGISNLIESRNGESKGVPSGTLRSICAAHGAASSNGPIFEKLTKGILGLMFSNDNEFSKDVVAKVFEM